jgi:hypothetical protein
LVEKFSPLPQNFHLARLFLIVSSIWTIHCA